MVAACRHQVFQTPLIARQHTLLQEPQSVLQLVPGLLPPLAPR